jgi:hypothetical protein
MSTKTGLKTGFPAAGIGERYFSHPGVLVAALAAVVAAAGATGYGFLAHIPGHPTVRLAGALALAAGGLAAVLVATPPRRPAAPVPGGRGPSSALSEVEGTRTGAAILGLLSVAVALIHSAVIEQHWSTYWLYGAFFILVGFGPARLGAGHHRRARALAAVGGVAGTPW